jgi:hypothetical protein
MSATEIVPLHVVDQPQAIQLLLALEQAGAVTPTSLDLSDTGMEFERYEALGTFLGAMKRWTSWAIGDWINFGEGLYGERFAQGMASTGLNEQTLLHYSFVCRQIPQSRRQVLVAFGAHALVARMEPREQSHWLKQAARKGWAERELREAIKAKRVDQRPEPLFDGEEGSARTTLGAVARAILRDAVPHIDGQHHLIPNEDMARLKVALGEED